MRIKFHATLRDVVGGSSVEMPEAIGQSVSQVLAGLVTRYPGLKKELLDPEGNLYPHVHFFVNGRDAQFLDSAFEYVLKAEDTVNIFPAVGGG
jgi:molybdopterin synthase sulfur carrier subunit